MTEPVSPSLALASEIADALIGAGLLRSERREDVLHKIATAKMAGADWKTEIDLAADKAAKK